MAEPRAHPAPARLPTLTEVMQEGRGVPALRRVSEAAAPPVPERAAEAAAAADPGGTPVDEARIVEAVLSGLQQRVDLMLEYRLREALAPLGVQPAQAAAPGSLQGRARHGKALSHRGAHGAAAMRRACAGIMRRWLC